MESIVLPKYQEDKKNLESFNHAIEDLGINKMWDKNLFGQDVTIAVIDSGCDVKHTELKQNIFGYYNFTKDDKSDKRNVSDYLGHGTHVAGIIASQNKQYITGVAPSAKLLILKVIDKNGTGSIQNLIRAINYAIKWTGPNKSKVNIINISLGTSKEHQDLRTVINKAINEKITVVAAAGNGGDGNHLTDEIIYPGYYEEVFQIGATDRNKLPITFSNSNKNIDFLAPGQDIFSTVPKNKFSNLSGTSMAAPHITGLIALLKSKYRDSDVEMTDVMITNFLKNNATSIPNIHRNIQGLGLVSVK